MSIKKQSRDTKGKYTNKLKELWKQLKDFLLIILLLNILIGYLGSLNIAVLGETFRGLNNTKVSVIQIAGKEAQASTLSEDKSYEVDESLVKELQGEFSAYNAEEAQTDSDPFTTASGKRVSENIVANNCLPFGTKIKIGEKYYEVQDRMNSRYDCNHFDIFMNSHDEAIKFGRKQLSYQIK